MMMKIGATNEKNDVQSNWAGVLIGPVWESCAWSLMVSSRMAERGARMGGAGRARPSAGQPAIIAKPLLTQTCSWARLIESVAVAAVAQWIEYRPPKPRVVGSIPASRTKINDIRGFLVAHVTVKVVPMTQKPWWYWATGQMDLWSRQEALHHHGPSMAHA